MTAINDFDASRMMVTVFDKNGTEFHCTRPNARELVNTGKYYWKAEDAGKTRLEDDGPVDPAADEITVYNDAGQSVTTSAINARELVNSGKYTWIAKHSPIEPTAPVTANDPATEVTPKYVEPATDPFDTQTASLAELATQVTGESDVVSYLNTFSEENLRGLSEERYGEKLHHRASKETLVTKIVEFENAQLDEE